MSTFEWRKNEDNMWAWFDGDRQVTGARGEIGSGRPFANLDAQGRGLETAHDALPGETVADYVLRVHGLIPREVPPAAEVTIATHPEFPRLVQAYGHLTLAEMDILAENMQAEAQSALSQHVREFSARGRRYGPAMSTQAGREIGTERLLLCAYREHVRQTREMHDCPAPNHLSPDNTKVVTVADCGWCNGQVVVR